MRRWIIDPTRPPGQRLVPNPEFRHPHDYRKRQFGKPLRRRVWTKTGGLCFYCDTPVVATVARGQKPPPDYMHVDHLHPHVRGGDEGFDNLVPACSYCNMQKSSMPPKVFAIVVVLREFSR